MAQERMIDELLSQLDALHAAATQGEWEVEPSGDGWIAAESPDGGDIICESPAAWDVSLAKWPANGRWIVAAHNHYPALREEIERLQTELATAKRAGAVEELRRLADGLEKTIWSDNHRQYVDYLRERANELEGK